MTYATIDDITALFRALTPAETEKATALLPVVSDSLRQAAYDVGKDLDRMIANGEVLPNVVKSVTVDVVARALMTQTNEVPMSQFAQSANGYSVSGTFLVPGGGLFIKKAELSRLGITRQQVGGIELYEATERRSCDALHCDPDGHGWL